MGLKVQNVDGRLTLNGIRHMRQYAVTGHHVQLDDIAALISQYLELDAEVTRLRATLNTLERDALADRASAWTEGWVAGTDATVRDLDPTARVLALVEAAGFEENPYAAQLDAPVVEDLPEVTC